jgi:spore maturation protein CgeB
MRSQRILYVGYQDGTCLDRANALRRLGHEVEHIDPRPLLPQSNWVGMVTWKLGGNWFGPRVARKLPEVISGSHYDLCYVDGGEWVTPRVVNVLRRYADKVINYNIDDWLGSRDGARCRAYRQSIPHYDLCIVMRDINVTEARTLGARDVLRVWMSSDEVQHVPRDLTQADHEAWDCDVLFVGTWFPERGPFMLGLIERGVPLTIRGQRWHKAPEWEQLRAHWKSGPIYGDDYAKAIQCARVNLGLLSRGSRDLHTTRSSEIPSLGALLCAERTTEHLGMYDEGVEALFWGDVEECATMCRYALEDNARRHKIAAAGRARFLRNGTRNERVMSEILEAALRPGLAPPHALASSALRQ